MLIGCHRRCLPCALLCMLGAPLPVKASESDPPPVALEPIVVVATKRARPLSNVAGQVSVIEARDIEAGLVEGIDELFRYEPGLDVETRGTRFGVSGFVIRGIGGNRVAVEVDGVPLRDAFAIGSYSSGGRALLDTDRIKRLEILHGPASTLYGSDALGGVLAVTTWDPDDLVGRAAGSEYYAARAGFADADDSLVGSALAAWAKGPHGAMVSATLRTGHERDSSAAASTHLDSQDWDTADYSARWTFDTPSGDRVRFSAERYERDAVTRIVSLPGYARFRTTTDLSGDDRDEREQWLLDYDFSRPTLAQGVVRAFHASSLTRQTTLEERAVADPPVRLNRHFEYRTELSGLEINLFRDFARGGGDHRLGAGIEYLHAKTNEFRDGVQYNILTGSFSRTILGETFPVRDFPTSTTREAGLFVQDEISLADGRWELTPAVRWEYYRLEPDPDPVYREDNPHVEAVTVSEYRLNPRIGAVYRFGETWSAYGQYVEGFRAPPLEDANIGLDIPLFNIRALPNPDLKSETSKGLEIGLRRLTDASLLSLALFDTRFDDFIESRALIGVEPATGVLLFQSRNISSARIHGVDLRYQHSLVNWWSRLEGWSLSVAAYWSRGENRDTGQPLNSVAPAQAVMGLDWTSGDGQWDLRIAATLTARQDRIDETRLARFATPDYALFDLAGGWRVNDHVTLRAALRNLTDETYWRWLDVANLAVNDPMIPLLARPGRSLSVSVKFEF